LAEYNARHDLELTTYASLEAQIAAIADDIAYNHHDLHDGLRAGLFEVADIMALPLVGPCFGEVDTAYPDIDPTRRRHEALRRFFGVLVEDVIAYATTALGALDPASPQDIRHAGRAMVRFSDQVFADLKEVRAFLFTRMYRAPRVVETRAIVTDVVNDLFPHMMAHPDQLPRQWQAEVHAAQDDTTLARLVCDYIAGMTDRFALQTHRRIFNRDLGLGAVF
jgi:dGTPase